MSRRDVLTGVYVVVILTISNIIAAVFLGQPMSRVPERSFLQAVAVGFAIYHVRRSDREVEG